MYAMLDTWLYTWPSYTPNSVTDWFDYCSLMLSILSLTCYIFIVHSSYAHMCTCTFLFILTHLLGVLTPYFYISRSMTIYYWSGIGRGSQAYWGAWSLLCLITGTLASPLSLLNPYSLYITFYCHSISYSSVIMCGHLCVISQCYHVIIVVDIACSGSFRLSVYTWGIFLAYLRRRLSSQCRFWVFWEVGHDKWNLLLVLCVMTMGRLIAKIKSPFWKTLFWPFWWRPLRFELDIVQCAAELVISSHLTLWALRDVADSCLHLSSWLPKQRESIVFLSLGVWPLHAYRLEKKAYCL